MDARAVLLGGLGLIGALVIVAITARAEPDGPDGLRVTGVGVRD